MYNYATLDNKGYVIGLSILSGIIEEADMVLLNVNDDVSIGQKYDLINKTWTNEFIDDSSLDAELSESELLQIQLTELELQNLETQAQQIQLLKEISELKALLSK